MTTKQDLVGELVVAALETLDCYPRLVAMPEEDSATALNLNLTLANFFNTLIDNLNESAREKYDAPQT
jgi:hypothetical protein